MSCTSQTVRLSASIAVLSLAACGGGSGGNPVPPPNPVAPVATESPAALQASLPGALLAYVQNRLNLQIEQGLARNGEGAVTLTGVVSPGVATTTASSVTPGSVSAADTVAPSFSSTTLQEGGVDESDILKTDGNRLFAMTVAAPGDQRLGKLSLHLRQGDGSLQPAGSFALPSGDRFDGLHLAANGEINFIIRGLTARVRAEWRLRAADDAGDRHHARYHGTSADLELNGTGSSGSQFRVRPHPGQASATRTSLTAWAATRPGITLIEEADAIAIRPGDTSGHEAHFAAQLDSFLSHVDHGPQPAWERHLLTARYQLLAEARQRATE